jgi:hypothetical protein
VYATANARSGNSAALRAPRARAMSSATARISGVDHSMIWMSSQNAWSSPGNESQKISPLKNDRRTLSHPGACGTSRTTAVTAMIVLVVAMMTERLRLARS